MNSKTFTLTALFLFFIVKISSQNIYVSSDNIIDINFVVADGFSGQYFTISSEEEHFVSQGSGFIFKIHLDYLSQQDVTHYFGIQYKLTRLLPDGTPGEIIRGITAPVIIPPVKKKKTRIGIRPEEYPFSIHGEHALLNAKYKVEMNLAKYRTRYDYFNETGGYDRLLPGISFELNATHNMLITENTSNSFSMLAYPNPTVNSVTFEYTGETPENATLQQRSLGVTIFNDKGKLLSQQTLTNASTKANSISYNLDILYLPKGIYYVQLIHKGKKHVKTIIKE